MAQIAEEVGRYCGILDKMGYGNNIQLDFSMVNDIDYYNGIIFHGYVRNLPGVSWRAVSTIKPCLFSVKREGYRVCHIFG